MRLRPRASGGVAMLNRRALWFWLCVPVNLVPGAVLVLLNSDDMAGLPISVAWLGPLLAALGVLAVDARRRDRRSEPDDGAAGDDHEGEDA